MNPFENEGKYEATFGAVPIDAAQVQSDFMNRVYRYMALGLGATGVTAMAVASTPAAIEAVVNLRWVLLIATLGLVVALSGFAHRMSAATATGLFFAYPILTGLTMSFIFLMYTQASAASTFFVTGGTFGAMSLYGARTKRDLTS